VIWGFGQMLPAVSKQGPSRYTSFMAAPVETDIG
jgi:hypothetical protein